MMIQFCFADDMTYSIDTIVHTRTLYKVTPEVKAHSELRIQTHKNEGWDDFEQRND